MADGTADPRRVDAERKAFSAESVLGVSFFLSPGLSGDDDMTQRTDEENSENVPPSSDEMKAINELSANTELQVTINQLKFPARVRRV